MCGIYCVYKQSSSCQLPFCTSHIYSTLKLEIFPFTCSIIAIAYSIIAIVLQ